MMQVSREVQGRNRICILLVVILLFSAITLSGCGEKTEKTLEEGWYRVYFLNTEETKMMSEDYEFQTDEALSRISEIVEILRKGPDSNKMHSVLSGAVTLLSCNLDDGKLYLDFDANYMSIDKTTEVLARAALVRTFCQIPEVKSVTILVNGAGLTDTHGDLIGAMVAEQFVDNDGKEVNNYEQVTLTLFFANENGDKLLREKRTVVYNSNVSLQKLVLEQLLAGPAENGHYRTIDSTTKVISVTVTDNVCYVNLSAELQLQSGNVNAEATVYSIVNSLTSFADVDKVQISIDGNSEVLLREMINLNTVFERNREIIE